MISISLVAVQAVTASVPVARSTRNTALSGRSDPGGAGGRCRWEVPVGGAGGGARSGTAPGIVSGRRDGLGFGAGLSGSWQVVFPVFERQTPSLRIQTKTGAVFLPRLSSCRVFLPLLGVRVGVRVEKSPQLPAVSVDGRCVSAPLGAMPAGSERSLSGAVAVSRRRVGQGRR